MTRATIRTIIAAAYAVIAIFTYGHSASHGKVPNCLYVDHGICTIRAFDPRAGDAFFAALVWPLYWSWELQE